MVMLSRELDREVIVGEQLAIHLFKIAVGQQNRFIRLGQVADIEEAIANFQKAVQSTDDEHPYKPRYLLSLGMSQRERFERLEHLPDIDNSISNIAKVVQLIPDGHPDQSSFHSNLGLSQRLRYIHVGEQEDIEQSILNQLRALSLVGDGHPAKARYYCNLAVSYRSRFGRLGDVADIEECIANLEKAVQIAFDGDPEMTKYLSHLGLSHLLLYNRLGRLEDIEDCVSNMEKALQLTEDGHPFTAIRLSHLGLGQQVRYNRLGELTDIEQSILNLQKAVLITEDAHPGKPTYLSNLAISQRARFERLGELSDIENCIANLQRGIHLTPDGHPNMPKYLSNLGLSHRDRFERLGKLADIEDCISNIHKAVQLTKDGHPEKAKFLSHLGLSQLRRFDRLGGLRDIEDSILNQKCALQLTDDGDPVKTIRFSALGSSYRTRFDLLCDPADLEASISAFKTAARSKTGYPRDALKAARKWANLSHQHNDLSSAFDGYRTAIELLPKVAWLGLSTASRQISLSEEVSENLSCLAATCAIQQARLEEAVELLDLGRAVFWQQASSLRVELTALKGMEPELADQLERVGQKLDAGNFSGSRMRAEEQNIGSNSTEDAAKERRRLVAEWEGLLERIRRLPRFEHFLKPVPFHQLRQAAAGGQIIIINANPHGAVDALIFDAIDQIEHVPLPDANFEALSELASNILLHRPINASEAQRRNYTNRYLKPALRMVWNDILMPIFTKIQLPFDANSDAPQRRIWWYPTGPLTFIPIHAAGPGGGKFDVSHLAVSSYVTTLISLFQAKSHKESGVKQHLKLLAISQSETPGQEPLPLSMEEVDVVVQVVSSAAWPPEDIKRLNGPDATVESVSSALDSSSWVHFACHGMQHPTSGLHSAFALHNGHLELNKIASKRLSTGQFAFLSACHTAAGLGQLPGEAMHLAGGLQFAGFPSVIATMWGVRDTDTAFVASEVYQYLFRNKVQGCDPSEAAMALNQAVQRLRETHSSLPVDRWAPFIHFGI